MQYTRDRLWLKHKYRHESNECPRCSTSIRWVYDGAYWIPCDKEPVYYIRDRDSKVSIVKRKTLIDGVLLYQPGMDLGNVNWDFCRMFSVVPERKGNTDAYKR